MRKGTKRKKQANKPIAVMVRAALCAVGVTAVLVFAESLMLYWKWIGEDALSIGNLCIKILSAAVAGVLVGRRIDRRAWLYGAIAAAIYEVLTVGVMWLYLGSATFNLGLVSDLLMVVCVGAVTAALPKLVRRQT